jgi:Carboxypeptidase regulatory-like domain
VNVTLRGSFSPVCIRTTTRGTVRDGDGKPISGAVVAISPEITGTPVVQDLYDRDVARVTRTHAKGCCVFTDILTGNMVVTATANGFLPGYADPVLLQPERAHAQRETGSANTYSARTSFSAKSPVNCNSGGSATAQFIKEYLAAAMSRSKWLGAVLRAVSKPYYRPILLREPPDPPLEA